MVAMRWISLLYLLLSVSTVGAQESYYRGKTVTFLVGAPPGGGFDTMTRIVARHLGRNIPGNPIVVVQNMPGAGTVIAANHLYNRSKPDGLTIGVWVGSLTLQKMLGGTGLEFDPLKFEWIGVPVQQTMLCAFTKASGINSMDKWQAAKTPLKMGGQVPGTRPDDISTILKAALNLPIQLVQGYKARRISPWLRKPASWPVSAPVARVEEQLAAPVRSRRCPCCVTGQPQVDSRIDPCAVGDQFC